MDKSKFIFKIKYLILILVGGFFLLYYFKTLDGEPLIRVGGDNNILSYVKSTTPILGVIFILYGIIGFLTPGRILEKKIKSEKTTKRIVWTTLMLPFLFFLYVIIFLFLSALGH
tara:strand:- start:97 stop:438 length:342 start_codon:yes stop_codon:yes gene_type:complete